MADRKEKNPFDTYWKKERVLIAVGCTCAVVILFGAGLLTATWIEDQKADRDSKSLVRP